jgi:hypothetical protein
MLIFISILLSYASVTFVLWKFTPSELGEGARFSVLALGVLYWMVACAIVSNWGDRS